MTIARDDLAAYLDNEFSALAQVVGQAEDPVLGYAPSINNALRKLGVLEDDLEDAVIEDVDRDTAIALAEYYALRRFWRQLGDRVNHTMGQTTMTFTNQMTQVKAMMDEAAERCADLGASVRGSSWTAGFMNLDWQQGDEE